jgi:hypothetical protein
MIFGLDFLCNQAAPWDFDKNTTTIAGVEHQLHTRSTKNWCRRVILGEDVTLASSSESVVFTNVAFQGKVGETNSNNWATSPCQPAPGVSVARAVIPARTSGIPVRVFNGNAKPICLPAGTVVSQLDRVEVCDVSLNGEQKAETKRADAIKRMVDGVDPEISDLDRDRLAALLVKFSSAFSFMDNELRRTTVAIHSIDTGTA